MKNEKMDLKNLSKYYLQIADNALILSHRLSEFCSHAPFLEEDLANTNVALDLIGLAESVYIQVAENEDIKYGLKSDELVYHRDEQDFYNCILVEQANEDFAHIITRQFFMDCFHYYFFTELSHSKDKFLNALALKSLKEVTYHLRRSSEWMIRLGDGTLEASEKTQIAVNKLWKFTAELFEVTDLDLEMQNARIGVDLNKIRSNWIQKVNEICFFAKITVPRTDKNVFQGKKGIHSENLGHILCEMQFLTNKFPDAIW